jgi:hypothetical protein
MSSSPVGTAAVVQATQATGTIPIVFAPVIDPVRSGLVRSLARPAGNVTGVTLYGWNHATRPQFILRLSELLHALAGTKVS